MSTQPILSKDPSSTHNSTKHSSSSDFSSYLNNSQAKNPKFITMFIGGIATSETEEDVLPVLQKIAKINYFKLIKKPNTNQNKGFGFIHVSNKEEAEKINKAKIIINGKLAETYIAKPRREARKRVFTERFKKVFVGGLNPNTTHEGLKECFGCYGKLLRAYVISDSNTKKSRCFGFLEFDDEEVADKILKIKLFNLDNHVIEVKEMMLKTELQYFKNKKEGYGANGYENYGYCGDYSGGNAYGDEYYYDYSQQGQVNNAYDYYGYNNSGGAYDQSYYQQQQQYQNGYYYDQSQYNNGYSDWNYNNGYDNGYYNGSYGNECYNYNGYQGNSNGYEWGYQNNVESNGFQSEFYLNYDENANANLHGYDQG